MKLLITGALGHIGSKLIHNLHSEEWEEVVLLDNLTTQRYPVLFSLPPDINFRFIQADVTKWNMNLVLKDMDVVIHLAALTDAGASLKQEREYQRVNYSGAIRIAHLCEYWGCKLIFPSTTSVYGSQLSVVDEDCQELKPQSPYAQAKLDAERTLSAFPKLKFVILRLGTVFGYSLGMRFHTMVNKFIWEACSGQLLSLWAESKNKVRPYLDLVDCTAAFQFVVDEDLFDRQVYNVATIQATPQDVIDCIRGMIEANVLQMKQPILNQLSYAASTKRFEAKGFQFKGDLERGVRETIEALKGIRSLSE